MKISIFRDFWKQNPCPILTHSGNGNRHTGEVSWKFAQVFVMVPSFRNINKNFTGSVGRRHCSSSSPITKWAARISGKPFDLESPHLHGHPNRPTLQPNGIWRDQLLPVWSYREKTVEMPPPTASGGTAREVLMKRSQNVTRLSGTIATQTYQIWRH